jgi:lipoprotein-anchoring transpeptidase ErfK/SrfK
VFLATPAAAEAVTLKAPLDVLARATITASLTASDPAGVAVLLVDGVAVRSPRVSGGGERTVTFTDVPFAPGVHRVRLTIRGDGRLVSSPVGVVTAWGKPVPPLLVSPSGYCNATAGIVVKAGPGTTRVTAYVNGRWAGSKAVTPGQVVTIARTAMARGWNTIQIEASNPVANTRGTFRVRRLDIPWATCLIIDKSEFRLYWVRNWAVVKVYPVAIGKPSTPTPSRNWRVGAKYVYEYWGVYGPRRLRLFKQVGPHSFTYTGYGVHGTNQEWVIGTMASHGCIRMYNRDVLELYPQVPMYTMVQTRD